MRPITRWRLAFAALAALYTVNVLSSDGHDPVTAKASRTRSAHISTAYRAPVKASRADIEALVRKLQTARTTREVRALSQQLGVIGDDRAIDEVRFMVADRRAGVPDLIIGAIGAIGTDHAVDVLVEMSKDTALLDAALDGLGNTHNAKAEPLLASLAKTGHLMATLALGELGTDGSVEVLVEIATMRTTAGTYAISALGDSAAPAAAAALRKLNDSPSTEIASAAIGAIQQVDDELFAKLLAIVKTGEAGLVEPALGALARAGDRAYETLRDAAQHGPPLTRNAAIGALIQLRSDDAMKTIATILDSGDLQTARAAIEALRYVQTDTARDLLISSALSDRRNFTGALQVLMTMSGPEVEEAMLTIAKSDREHRFEVIGQLVSVGNTGAVEMLDELILHGNESERTQALSVLGQSSTPVAAKTLIDLARAQSGETQLQAIGMLAMHASNPDVARLLRDRLENGTPEQAAAAAGALATAGTTEARDALIAALSNGDDDLTRTALSSLASFRLTDEMSTALAAAAKANPELLPEVMMRLVNENSPQGFELARTALASDHADTAQEAITSLERSGTPAAIQLIEGTLSSRDADVRRRGLQALGQMHATGAEETVIGALRDSDPEVRTTALQTLGTLGTDRAKATLIDLARTGTAEDKQTVISSLQDVEDPAVAQTLGNMIHDADAQVAISAIDAVISRGVNIDSELAAIAADSSKSRDVRMRAAGVLEGAGILDPRVLEELQKDGDVVSPDSNPDDGWEE
jgi:HEAT repeat protein